MLITGCKPRTSVVVSDPSTNIAKTTSRATTTLVKFEGTIFHLMNVSTRHFNEILQYTKTLNQDW